MQPAPSLTAQLMFSYVKQTRVFLSYVVHEIVHTQGARRRFAWLFFVLLRPVWMTNCSPAGVRPRSKPAAQAHTISLKL